MQTQSNRQVREVRQIRGARSATVAAGLAAGLILGGTGPAAAQDEASGNEGGATCAAPEHAGGDWPVYGQNRYNSRSQAAETTIGVGNVAQLEPAWTFTPKDVEGFGRMESTPVVAEGCVYFATSSGFVYALNADTGALVWGKRVAETTRGQCCGGTIFAGTVHDGVVYFGVARAQREADPISGRIGTFIVALDSQTGEEIWKTPELALEDGAYTNSSAVYYEGLVWLGISGPEIITPGLGDPSDRPGGFVIVDAATGDVLVRTRTVPEEEFAIRGDGGGSIWSTLAIDDDGYGYASTGQPNPWEGSIQSDYTNAIIKIDMKRERDGEPNPSFGQIVGTFWGDPDSGRDVDFAGSPTLFRHSDGRQMVAALQKSGNLHAGFTSSIASAADVGLLVGKGMTHAWAMPLSGVGSPLYNFCSVANDGATIYGAGAVPGQLWAVDASTGVPRWVKPVNSRNAAQPVTLANGVVYFPGQNGTLYAFDAASGDVLLERSMDGDVGTDCSNIGGGIAIARNTVYAMCGDRGSGSTGPTDADSGWITAYRLP